MNNLSGKSILITGATSGIGRATVLACTEEGVRVVVACGRDTDKLAKLSEEVRQVNPDVRIIAWAGDFLLLPGFDDLTGLLDEESVLLDGAVFSAGIDKTLPINITTDKVMTDLLRLNTVAPIELIRQLIRKKRLKNPSSLVFISSVMGLVGQPGKTAYCASKGALIGAAKALALELAPQSINVNVVAPGIVETPLTDKLFKMMTSENLNQLKQMHPLGFGKPEDVANLATFLLSNKAAWITGSTITIDGGYSTH
jgi:NAD(P)-dependent dehydrogenase (short-subunit alcohol dehydrogenase family)